MKKMKTKITIALAFLILGLYMVSLTSALTITSVSTSPESIAPGETSDVSLTIRNI